MASTTHWLAPEEQSAWHGFIRMQARLTGRLARELQNETGLSAGDYAVLVALTDAPDGRLRVLELARAVEWEKSRLSHRIGRMAGRGLVERVECEGDARGAFVVLTEGGRQAIERAAPGHVATVRRLALSALSPDEIRLLGHISERILDRLEQDSHTPGDATSKGVDGTRRAARPVL
ncbi:MarR family winged helix-turn-helix transcriptional regulator [Streptomyces sp. NPDC094448]|uniref:MarR family winged helix-turn-helix transcriptional regulator n=1 Tax=Streptomyces sp. NPDC094448 TaxID=3366063 RepID=UPI00382AA2CA